MLLSDFIYELPDERIARYPLPQRDQSRLMTYQDGEIAHHHFEELPELLPAGTLLVFNNTRVIPARALLRKQTGAWIEILLLHPEEPTRIVNDAMLVKETCVWECMIGNKKKWKREEALTASLQIGGKGIVLEVRLADPVQNLVQFRWEGDIAFLEVVMALGEVPLPPYLGRKAEASDSEQYQTVYARQNGAVAAPTAGLHFTERVLEQLRSRQIGRAFVTLHVGAGTFQPIKTEQIEEHRMHTEQIVFSKDLIGELMRCRGKVVAVGTTSLRSLESLYWLGVKLGKEANADLRVSKKYPYGFEEHELPTAAGALAAVVAYMEEQGLETLTAETGIFIFPGYTFRMVKGLITNYHQPGSTLILLVATFVGEDWRRIYSEALASDYRFLSYGDSSLLWLKAAKE